MVEYFINKISEKFDKLLENYLAFDLPYKKLFKLINGLIEINYLDPLMIYSSAAISSVDPKYNRQDLILNIIFFETELQYLNRNYFNNWYQYNKTKYYLDDTNFIQCLVRNLDIVNFSELIEKYDEYTLRYLNLLTKMNLPWSSYLNSFDKDDFGIKRYLNNFLIVNDLNKLTISDAINQFKLNLELNRKILNSTIFPRKIVLVEGFSEAILLPHLALIMGYDFNQLGIFIYPAGGCKRIVKLYNKFKEIFNLSIICLFDGDALIYANAVKASLRNIDKVLILPVKETENLFAGLKINDLMLSHPNFLLFNDVEVSLNNFKNSKDWLNQIAKATGINYFGKLDFAKALTQTIVEIDKIPQSAKNIIINISNDNKSVNT